MRRRKVNEDRRRRRRRERDDDDDEHREEEKGGMEFANLSRAASRKCSVFSELHDGVNPPPAPFPRGGSQSHGDGAQKKSYSVLPLLAMRRLRPQHPQQQQQCNGRKRLCLLSLLRSKKGHLLI